MRCKTHVKSEEVGSSLDHLRLVRCEARKNRFAQIVLHELGPVLKARSAHY
jgi:hypothetical protein